MPTSSPWSFYSINFVLKVIPMCELVAFSLCCAMCCKMETRGIKAKIAEYLSEQHDTMQTQLSEYVGSLQD